MWDVDQPGKLLKALAYCTYLQIKMASITVFDQLKELVQASIKKLHISKSGKPFHDQVI